jgi:hypothetical protein
VKEENEAKVITADKKEQSWRREIPTLLIVNASTACQEIEGSEILEIFDCKNIISRDFQSLRTLVCVFFARKFLPPIALFFHPQALDSYLTPYSSRLTPHALRLTFTLQRP